MSTATKRPQPANTLGQHATAGGIYPPACKTAALHSRIMPMPIPPVLTLPLLQYDNSLATPCVKVGDQVRKYECLTEPGNTWTVAVHAPTSGRITAIHEAQLAGAAGLHALCIELTTDGTDDAIAVQELTDFRALDRLQLLQRIAAAGICGMGGAGFPTAEKLRVASTRGTKLIIINGVECEPYICADQALLRERAAAVVLGADILRAACLAPRCVIAVKRDMTDAIAALREALTHSAIELLLVENKYPAGSERQLIETVTGWQVPTGKLPVDLGLLMLNAGTAYATQQAVMAGKPCVSRITTLTGGALRTPKNFEALIGTPVSFLLQLCGVDTQRHSRTILGGSLMGVGLTSSAVPVTATTNCLIAATAEEFPPATPEQACIRCGYCAEVCPARLLPQQLYNFARIHAREQLVEHGLPDCIECGACDYVCPSHIPLVQYYRAAKEGLRDGQQQLRQRQNWRERFQFHQERSQREKERPRERRPAASTVASPPPNAVGAGFSRTRAQEEIAAAVARAKAKQAGAAPLSKPPDPANQPPEDQD